MIYMLVAILNFYVLIDSKRGHYANFVTLPTGNMLPVTCMLHEIIIDLHGLPNMHVVMLMYGMFHVTCMDLGRFSSMCHACYMTINMNVTCMLQATKM